MDSTPFTPREGMTVYGSDGDKVGEIDAVETDYVVVRKGVFFPKDHSIPFSAVDTYDDDAIYLAYTRDEVLSQNWNTGPQAGTSATTTVTGAQAGDRDAASGRGDRIETDRNHITVPVHEEDLVTSSHEVERGTVRIEKHVITEEQSIDVPVIEERVEVTRRSVDRAAGVGNQAFEETTIAVPVRGEVVDIEKRTRVVGEVDVDKTAEQYIERVTDTVRREEVTVDDEVIETTEFDDEGRRRIYAVNRTNDVPRRERGDTREG